MDIDTLRRYCLSFPQATEGMQWGDNLLFRVAGKIFAIVSLDSTPLRLAFKCTPAEFAELIEREGIVPAPYMARNHWVSLEGLNVLPRADIKRLIHDSYHMIAAKLPKKVKSELGL
ncbi:MAG TPA: MmcQ/YjbR family DNA-binding protein [Bryobacteraceae bacterium]|nr:MmcQ/YjbR family DNA-binding protein [Bryobacteraceae bacterium]